MVTLVTSALSSPLAIQNTWEKEFGATFAPEWWQATLDRVNSTSLCASLTLIQFKILHRAHLTKVRLNKLFDTSEMCDRCHLAPADHTHTFYSCSRLAPFWSSVYDTLSRVLGRMVAPSPFISIFGVPEIFSSFTRKECNIIAFVSLVARRHILLHWKDPKPPSSNSWLKDLMSFLCLEKIKYSLRGSSDRFDKTWDPLLSYFNSLSSLGD